MLTLTTEPTSNKKKLEYVPSAQFGFTDVDKEKDTVYKMTDAVNKTGRFLADQAQQYKLTADNGSTKGWTADNVGDITKFFTGDRVGQFSLSAVDVARMTDKAGIPAAYQNTYFLAEFISAGPKDTMVTLSPRIPVNDAISIVKIWYNCKNGIILHTEFHSSDVQNEAKYQHPQLTRDDSTAIYLPAKTNWDTLNRTGYYYSANTGVNTPVGGGFFSLEVIASSGTGYITQRATQNNGDVYIRVYTSNKWTSWALQATTAYVDNKVKTAVDAGQSYPLTKAGGWYKYSFSETSNIETEFAKEAYNSGSVYIPGGNPFIKSAMGGQSFLGYAYTLNIKDVGYLMGMTRPGHIWVNVRGDGSTWKGWKQLGTMDDITWSQNMLQKKINATQVHKLTADNGTTTSVDNQDWNTLKSTGLYHCNPAGANAPLPKGHLILEVLSIDNNANISQRATETVSNRVFKRGLVGGNWTAWALQATTDYVDNKVKTAVDAGQSYPLTKETGGYKYSFSETSNIETEFAKQSYNNGTVYITGGNPFIKSVMGGQSFFGYAHTLTMKDSGYLMGMTRPGCIWVNIMGDGYTWKGWKQLGTMDDITGSQNMLQNKINATTESQNMLQKKINATQVHKLTADNGTTTSVDNQDWNTLKSTGLYHCNPAGANAPLPKGHLILEVLSIDNNANIVQRATETMSNRVFKRGLAWGNWSAWTELQTKTHETYRVPLNTSVVKNYDDAHPFELNYANGVVSFCNTFSPIKEIPSSNDGFVIGTIADVRYRPTQTIRTLCQGSWDHVFLLNVGTDGSITASRNRSKDVYNLTFAAGEWCNASSSYTTNDTHA